MSKTTFEPPRLGSPGKNWARPGKGKFREGKTRRRLDSCKQQVF